MQSVRNRRKLQVKTYKNRLLQSTTILVILFFPIPSIASSLPEGFVYLNDVVPDIKFELRYYTENNFVGERIDGYLKSKCILSKKAALALKNVQADLKAFGLGLKVYDAYRPQRAVNHFVRWAKDLKDIKMKQKYYPDVPKNILFKEGYIAARSSHTRGSTIDLTIVTIDSNNNLDMGSVFDFFSPNSWPSNPSMTASHRAHRMLLQVLMDKHGFNKYDQEWWHFTLRNEPFSDEYFDFPIQ
ncbi:MAG: M15 family metallopeptidase [Gammaproteobacteria bacterium]|nr:M15 family metallopeptidase [Gammaproteobacteria bacterium]